MTSRTEVEAVILKFVEALNIDDASLVPLAEDVVYYSLFSSEPTRGAADVREHIDQVAPFMLNETFGKMIIEGGSAAVRAVFDSTSGIHVEGAYFFEVENGKIREVRAVFDTGAAFKGRTFQG